MTKKELIKKVDELSSRVDELQTCQINELVKEIKTITNDLEALAAEIQDDQDEED